MSENSNSHFPRRFWWNALTAALYLRLSAQTEHAIECANYKNDESWKIAKVNGKANSIFLIKKSYLNL